MDDIKTLKEARAFRYGSWSGNPKGSKYREGYCVKQVQSNYHFTQCSRKNGYGPDNLYCKQHAKKFDTDNITTYYKIGNYGFNITEVTVINETNHTITIGGDGKEPYRAFKISRYERYYDTYKKAVLVLKNRANNVIRDAKQEIKDAEAFLENVK